MSRLIAILSHVPLWVWGLALVAFGAGGVWRVRHETEEAHRIHASFTTTQADLAVRCPTV